MRISKLGFVLDLFAFSQIMRLKGEMFSGDLIGFSVSGRLFLGQYFLYPTVFRTMFLVFHLPGPFFSFFDFFAGGGDGAGKYNTIITPLDNFYNPCCFGFTSTKCTKYTITVGRVQGDPKYASPSRVEMGQAPVKLTKSPSNTFNLKWENQILDSEVCCFGSPCTWSQNFHELTFLHNFFELQVDISTHSSTVITF